MSKRIKPVASIETRQQFEALVDATCHLQLTLEKLINKRDRALAAVRDEHDGEIERLAAEIKANVLQAEKFATVRRDELLPGREKSAATSLAVFGFRIGNPTLVLLNRKWTWQSVLDALIGKDRFDLIITKQSPDKDAIKSKLDDEERAAIGTRIEQTECFYIDPKRDEAPEQRLTA